MRSADVKAKAAIRCLTIKPFPNILKIVAVVIAGKKSIESRKHFGERLIQITPQFNRFAD